MTRERLILDLWDDEPLELALDQSSAPPPVLDSSHLKTLENRSLSPRSSVLRAAPHKSPSQDPLDLSVLGADAPQNTSIAVVESSAIHSHGSLRDDFSRELPLTVPIVPLEACPESSLEFSDQVSRVISPKRSRNEHEPTPHQPSVHTPYQPRVSTPTRLISAIPESFTLGGDLPPIPDPTPRFDAYVNHHSREPRAQTSMMDQYESNHTRSSSQLSSQRSSQLPSQRPLPQLLEEASSLDFWSRFEALRARREVIFREYRERSRRGVPRL